MSGRMGLNLGCGKNKIKNCVNADSEESNNPDIIMSMKEIFPWDDEKFDAVYMFHVIEHIEKGYWPFIFGEVRRVLKTDGYLLISYPEFSKVVENWTLNYLGRKTFWEQTIYGLQRYPGDYHVSLMHTPDFIDKLVEFGFKDLGFKPEPKETYNTVVKAFRGELPLTYEKVLLDEVFQQRK